MSTLLIELTNEKALKLLEDLESLNLIRVIKKEITSKTNLSEKYAGKLSAETADKLQEEIEKSREY